MIGLLSYDRPFYKKKNSTSSCWSVEMINIVFLDVKPSTQKQNEKVTYNSLTLASNGQVNTMQYYRSSQQLIRLRTLRFYHWKVAPSSRLLAGLPISKSNSPSCFNGTRKTATKSTLTRSARGQILHSYGFHFLEFSSQTNPDDCFTLHIHIYLRL